MTQVVHVMQGCFTISVNYGDDGRLVRIEVVCDQPVAHDHVEAFLGAIGALVTLSAPGPR